MSAPIHQSLLDQEFDYYVKHQDEFVQKYDGRCVVLKGCKVIAVYDDELTAVIETKNSQPLGTFLVQQVSPGPDAYTHVLRSRVASV